MGWRFEAIKAAVRGRVDGLANFFMPRTSLPPPRNAQQWLELYGKSPRMSPVTRIATDLSIVPGRLMRIGANGDAEEVVNHPFLEFIANPNPLPEMSAAALWRLMEIWLLIKGEAFAVIERDQRGYPVELWPVPPHWILQTPSLNAPFYTIRSRNGMNRPVPIVDMFVMRELNPADPYARGLGMTEQLADEVETDEYMSKYSMAYFLNDASSGTILSAPGATEEQRRRLQAQWNKQFRGVHNAHATAVVNGELSVVKVSDSRKEMAFTESRKDIRDSINQHYNIPPEILGIVENSNRATATQAKIIYAENILTPRLLARQVAVNQQLVACWGAGMEYRYDDIVPEDQEYKLLLTKDGVSLGAITLNEWREMNGMDAMDGGDVLTPPYSVVMMRPKDILTQGVRQNVGFPEQNATITPSVTAHNAPFASAPPLDAQEAQRPETKATGHRRDAQRIFDAEQRARENLLKQQLDRYFANQARAIVTALYGETKADGDGWLEEVIGQIGGKTGVEKPWIVDLLQHELGSLIDWGTQRIALERIMRPAWMTAFDAGAEAAERVNGVTAVQQPMMTRALIERGMERLDAIEATTRKEIARSLAEGVVAGESNRQLTQRVQDRMPGVQAGRAEVIALTEVHTSIQAGNLEQLKAAGFVTKKWSAVMDGDTRDAHRDINGQERPIDERFSNGLLYPGDPSGPPEQIINCRCVLMPGKTVQQAQREEQTPVAMEPTFVNPRANRNSELLYRHAEKIKAIEGYEDVVIHATSDRFIVEDNSGEQVEWSAEKLANALSKSKTYHGGSLRLIACNSGGHSDSIAQELADALDVDVLAPTKTAFIHADGTITIGDDPFTNDGSWVIFRSRNRFTGR